MNRDELRRMQWLEERVNALSNGEIFTNAQTIGTGVGVAQTPDAWDITDLANAGLSRSGSDLIFVLGGLTLADCPRIRFSGGAFRFLANEDDTSQAGVATGLRVPKFRGDGDPVTVSGSVTGTSFTLVNTNSNYMRFRPEGLKLCVRHQIWWCSSTSGAYALSSDDFYLGTDGYTITTRVAPGVAPIFDRGFLL